MENLKPAKDQVGLYPEANCWGFTAFLLGWRSRLHSMTEELMLVRLRNRLDRIEQPKRFCIGDVAASWEGYWEGYCPPTGKMELLHTAVYIGKGEWLHQVGMNCEVRLSNFEAMLRSYPGRTTYYRRFAQ